MTCAFVVTDMSAQEPNEFELADIDEQTPSVTDQTQPRDSIVALEQQQIHDDSQLRVQGYPQSLLYILRAGGLSTNHWQIRRRSSRPELRLGHREDHRRLLLHHTRPLRGRRDCVALPIPLYITGTETRQPFPYQPPQVDARRRDPFLRIGRGK